MRNTIHLDQEISPYTVKHLEGDKETIEDVVGGEELDVPSSVIECRVEDVGWVYSTPKDVRFMDRNIQILYLPCHNPYKRKDGKDCITRLPVVGVSEQLGELQQGVRHVVEDHDKGPDPGEVAAPGEHHQQDGRVMMEEHLPEVLPLHVKELTDGEGPVE